MPLPYLPIEEIRPAVIGALRARNRLVVTAPTGSGKSTRLPQMLLDELGLEGRIIVLQPRRIAAVMLANRVAEERGGQPGGEIGYQTRFESAVSKETQLCFMTDGILLRRLLSEPELPGVSVVIFDEFHERSLANDLGLALVRKLQQEKRPDLKLIVMSATLEAEKVAGWLDNCPVLTAGGRLHPVTIRYLSMTLQRSVWDKAAEVIRDLCRDGVEGDILVFMPGVSEIQRTVEACRPFARDEELVLLPLYGELPPAEQRRVMRPVESVRKVIVATNIAETSLTIPGVRHVIDSGLARVNRYDPRRGLNILNLEPISQASTEQRAGRAGREAPGSCTRFWVREEQDRRPPATEPEILRVELAEPLLLLASLGCRDPLAFPWFQAPVAAAVREATELLAELGAIDRQTQAITPFGRQLSRFPAHPRLGRLMIEADRNGQFREAALLAALLSEQNPAQIAADLQRACGHRSAWPSDVLDAVLVLRDCERDHFSADAARRAGLQMPAAQRIGRNADSFLRQGERLGLGKTPGKFQPEALLKDLLRAFPDRIARRCGTGEYELAGGRRGRLPKETLFKSELLLALDAQEVGRGPTQVALLNLGMLSELRRDWLEECFPDDWDIQEELYWEDSYEGIQRRTRIFCLGVVVEETIDPAPASPAASALLAQRLADGKLRLPNWDERVDHWFDRVRWLADLFPERNLLRYDANDLRLIYENICEGATRYRHLKDIDCLANAKNALSWEDQKFVEENAPERLKLPGGRPLRLEYTPGQPAKGRARIQDLYDLPDLPVVASGRARILLDILAPNQRTVQITDDLKRFWLEHYPKLKKTLAPRYPKHKWR